MAIHEHLKMAVCSVENDIQVIQQDCIAKVDNCLSRIYFINGSGWYLSTEKHLFFISFFLHMPVESWVYSVVLNVTFVVPCSPSTGFHTLSAKLFVHSC